MRLLGRSFPRAGKAGARDIKKDLPFHSASGVRVRVVQALVYVNSRLETLQECLAAALESFKGHDFLIVCDSREDTTRGYLAEFAAEHSSRLVLNLDPLGYRRSVAKGIQLTDAQYLVILDSEIVSTAGSLRQLVEHLNASPEAEIALPLLNLQLMRYLEQSASDESDIATFVRASDPELIAAALDSSTRGVFYSSKVDGFRGHPCFALRRSAFSKFSSWKIAAIEPAVLREDRAHTGAPVELSMIAIPGSYVSCRSRKLPDICPEQLPGLSDVVGSLRSVLTSNAQITQLVGKRVLFLLPSPGGSGGAHSVVQEALGLRRCGLDARIVNLLSNQRAFERNYPEAGGICSYPANDDELLELARGTAIVIATSYTSVSALKKIVDRNSAVVPLYYIQDYEPWFYPEPGAQQTAAQASYTLVPKACGFAKTEWLRKTVRRMTGIEVAKIDPSLDRSLFNSLKSTRKGSSSVAITSMIRPNTARRNPGGTLNLLRKIKQKYGSAVDVRIFGCSDEELDQLEQARGFDFVNFGELNRAEVAEVLRGADIFLDLSASQAFGCTGLEAIAVGCAAVLPRDSGVEEYAIDGRNCLLVDTTNEAEAVAAVERLITDNRAVGRLRSESMRTSLRYSVRTAVWSLLTLFAHACDALETKLHEV